MEKRHIVHIEIPSADRQKTAQFYSDLFGWQFHHMEQPVPYTTFETANVGGGYPNLSDGYEPGKVLVYVESHDIEADLRRAESLGGKVVTTRMEIPGQGWFATFTDPTGNLIALYTGMMDANGSGQ